jgi:hypothetical protein
MYHRTTEENALRIMREQRFRLDSAHEGVWLAEVADYFLVRRRRNVIIPYRGTLLEITIDERDFLHPFEMKWEGRVEKSVGMGEWCAPPAVLNLHVLGIRIIETPMNSALCGSRTPKVQPIQR